MNGVSPIERALSWLAMANAETVAEIKRRLDRGGPLWRRGASRWPIHKVDQEHHRTKNLIDHSPLAGSAQLPR